MEGSLLAFESYSLTCFLYNRILRCVTGFCSGLGCEASSIAVPKYICGLHPYHCVCFIRLGEINQRLLSQNFEDRVIKIVELVGHVEIAKQMHNQINK